MASLVSSSSFSAQVSERTKELTLAAQRGDVEKARQLLTDRVSPDSQDEHGYTGLHWAARAGHTDVVKVLLQGNAKLDIQNNRQRTPLFWAAREGHTDITRALLQAKASPNIPDSDSMTPLCIAAKKRHRELVTDLLNAKADPDTTAIHTRTPLHRTLDHDFDPDSRNNDLAIVKALLQARARPDSQDHGHCCLAWSCTSCKGTTESRGSS